MTLDKSARILIVDDDAAFCTRSRLQLQREGYHVFTVANGAQGTSWLAENTADLMLVDYFMGDMTGDDFVRAAQQMGKTIPYIMITGAGDERLAVKMIRHGAADYIPKDTAVFELLPSVVARALREEQQRQKLQEIEQQVRLGHKILETLNQVSIGQNVINTILELIQGYLHFDAAAIRLRPKTTSGSGQAFAFPNDLINYDHCLCSPEFSSCSEGMLCPLETAGCLCSKVLGEIASDGSQAARCRKSFWTNSVSEYFNKQDGQLAEKIKQDCGCLNFETLAFIPLGVGADTIGLLQLADRRAGRLSEDTVRFFEGISNSVGVALQRRLVEEERRWEANVNAALAVLARDLISTRTLTEISERILEQACRLTGSPLGCVSYYDPNAGNMAVVDCMGNGTFLAHAHAEQNGGDFVFQPLTMKQTLLENDPEQAGPLADKLCCDVAVRRVVAVPATMDGGFVGQLVLVNAPREYTVRDAIFVERLADIYAIALQRHLAEHNLAESERTQRRMFDYSPVGAALAGLDYRFERVNAELCRLTGYREQELLQTDFLQITHPDDRQEILSWMKQLADGRVDSYQIDNRFVRKDGESVWVCASVRMIRDAQGQPQHFLPIYEDINQRKLYEQQIEREKAKFFAVLETLPTFVYIQNSDYQITFANKRFRDLYGDFENNYCYQLLRGRDQACSECRTTAVFETRRAAVWDWTDREGRSFIIYDSPLAGDGDEDLVLEVGMEVTELKRMQDELRQARAELEQRVEERTAELTKTVQALEEEIKARTNAERELHAYQQKLKQTTLELALTEDRERRQLAADLHDSVGQTLVFTQIKIESLREQVQDQDLTQELDDIDELVEQTIKDLHQLIFEISPPVLHELGFFAAVEWLAEQMTAKHDVPCVLQCSEESDITLSGDARIVLFRMVRELLINAVKHADASRIIVHIGQDKQDLHVVVEDDGRGFDMAAAQTQQSQKGGFGLFNVRERLDQLGGRLVLSSEPGRGTKAGLVVPYAAIQDVKRAKQA